MNRMTGAAGLDGEMTRYTYDAAGRRVETATGTLTTAYGYDSVGNLLTQVHRRPLTPICSLTTTQ